MVAVVATAADLTAYFVVVLASIAEVCVVVATAGEPNHPCTIGCSASSCSRFYHIGLQW
ncbi:hypothetical protein ACP4OV_029518 [Aristida adscensionis]